MPAQTSPKTPGNTTALPTEVVDLSTLHQDPSNARTHGPKNLEAIKSSLQHFGQVENLIVQASTRKIIGGNGRYEAMRSLGWKQCEVTLLDVDDTRATALGIALNRTSELASWDHGVLNNLLENLKDENFDLDGLGFSDDDLAKLSRQVESDLSETSGNDPDADEVPVDVEKVCKPGDLWQLGDHRLICADSTSIDAVERLCGGEKCDAVVTDPPYGVNYEKKQESLRRAGKTSARAVMRIDNDEASSGPDLKELLGLALGNASIVSRPGACWYVWAPPGPTFLAFAQVMTDLKIWRQTIVWVKDVFVLGHSDYHVKHEACLYGWKEGKHLKPPDRTVHTSWEMDRPKVTGEHPTMKPIELIERCLQNSTLRGDVVLDPFCGSGTTLIAAERLGRRCFAVEISPLYCDVILRRFENLTGKSPVLIDAGEEPADPKSPIGEDADAP